MSECLFCRILEEKKQIVFENELVYAIYDNFPVNDGHMLVIP